MDDKPTVQQGGQNPQPSSNVPVTPTPTWVDTISESTLTKGFESDINVNGDGE